MKCSTGTQLLRLEIKQELLEKREGNDWRLAALTTLPALPHRQLPEGRTLNEALEDAWLAPVRDR